MCSDAVVVVAVVAVVAVVVVVVVVVVAWDLAGPNRWDVASHGLAFGARSPHRLFTASNNSLVGTIPDSIGDWTGIRHVCGPSGAGRDLAPPARCVRTPHPCVCLLACVPVWASCSVFKVDSNKLEGSIPSTVSLWVNLQGLYVGEPPACSTARGTTPHRTAPPVLLCSLPPPLLTVPHLLHSTPLCRVGGCRVALVALPKQPQPGCGDQLQCQPAVWVHPKRPCRPNQQRRHGKQLLLWVSVSSAWLDGGA
jgi:hypothetical protein